MDTLKNSLVSAAMASIPPVTYAKPNYTRTNRNIKRLVLDKRRLQKEWQSNRSTTTRHMVRIATRRLANALKQEQELFSTSTKLCGRANRNLKTPIASIMRLW